MTYPPRTRTLFQGPEHWKATQCLKAHIPSLPSHHGPLGEDQEYLRCFKEGDDYIVRGYNLPALEELS